MRSTSCVIAAVALSAAASPVLADVIIIRALGPSAARYVAGHTLPDGARVVLLRGDQVVLLDAHGTRTVSGPGTFQAAGGAAANGPSLLALASNTAERRNRIGAVRNLPTNTAARRPNIFFVDVAAAGNVCVVDPAAVTLWRAMADAPATSTIIGAAGAPASVAWIKGQSTQPWPAALPIAAGGSYRIITTGTAPTLPGAPAGTPVAITFQLLAAPPADMPELAKSLIMYKCAAQVDVMVATTSTAAG